MTSTLRHFGDVIFVKTTYLVWLASLMAKFVYGWRRITPRLRPSQELGQTEEGWRFFDLLSFLCFPGYWLPLIYEIRTFVWSIQS
jgi:hypothetical protein